MSQLITPDSVRVSLPFVSRFADFFRTDEQIAVEWISPELKNVSLFTDLFRYDKSVIETFTIRGKPAYCAAVLTELASHGTILDKRPQNASVKFWIHLSGRRA